MGHVIDHAAGRECVVITEDKHLHKLGNPPSTMQFEVVPAGFMHTPPLATIKNLFGTIKPVQPIYQFKMEDIEKKLVKKHYDPGVDHDINPFIKDMLA